MTGPLPPRKTSILTSLAKFASSSPKSPLPSSLVARSWCESAILLETPLLELKRVLSDSPPTSTRKMLKFHHFYSHGLLRAIAKPPRASHAPGLLHAKNTTVFPKFPEDRQVFPQHFDWSFGEIAQSSRSPNQQFPRGRFSAA